MNTDPHALSGIRVLDLTHVQSGPSATQLLGMMGADVIKVEPPSGDITRRQLRDIEGVDSLYFTMFNASKRSVVLDLKSDEGRKALTELIRRTDVMVENFAPGVLDRLGFPWETLRTLNPRLVLGTIKGFGPGPYSDCKAYETIAQCMGGSAATTGWPDGPPTITGVAAGDAGSGLHLVIGILAALVQRQRTGRGQRIDVFMQDAVLNQIRAKLRDQQRLNHARANGPPSWGSTLLPDYPVQAQSNELPRSGNSGSAQPGTTLRCAPGGPDDLLMVIVQPERWGAIASLIGRPELGSHPDYATPAARQARQGEVWRILEAWTLGRTKFEAMRALNACDVPCGPVLTPQELLADPGLRERGMIAELTYPGRGHFLTVANPALLSDSPVRLTPPPTLGQHTEEVLAEIGLR